MKNIVLLEHNIVTEVLGDLIQEIKPIFNVEDVDIYYSLDGKEPVEHGFLTKGSIIVDRDCILRIRGVKENYISSVTYTYIIKYVKDKRFVKDDEIVKEYEEDIDRLKFNALDKVFETISGRRLQGYT